MKKYFILFLIILLALSGCRTDASVYEFRNQGEQIVSIELIQNLNQYGEGTDETFFHGLATLSGEECTDFMQQLCQLRIKSIGYRNPLWGYGAYFARVTYVNGDIEIYGSENIEYIACGDDPTGFSLFHFEDEEAFLDVLSGYINIPAD